MDSLTWARMGVDRLPLWCEICAVTAQLAHAIKHAAEIPALEKRLAALESEGRLEDRT
jgi:hypothetical protein